MNDSDRTQDRPQEFESNPGDETGNRAAGLTTGEAADAAADNVRGAASKAASRRPRRAAAERLATDVPHVAEFNPTSRGDERGEVQ